MNNQQWQPPTGPQRPSGPQWPQQQPPSQPLAPSYPGGYNAPSQPLPSPFPGSYNAPSQPPTSSFPGGFNAPSQPLGPASAPWGQQQPFAGEQQTVNRDMPPAQAMMPPPSNGGKVTPPRKKGFLSKKVSVPVWLVILTVLILLGSIITAATKSGSDTTASTGSSSAQSSSASQATAAPTTAPTQAPTPTPTPAPKWTTIQTFTGNGIKKTQVFTTGSDWKINWSCDPSSFYGGQYNLIVTVYGSDGSPIDVAVNSICKSGNTSDSTEEHQGGSIYLDINSEGAWKLQVQNLQ